jgi:hypothetical protein
MHTGYRGGQRNGPFRYWDDEGELVCEGSFENGEQSGEWVYYRFGIAYQRVEFDHDQQHQIESRYDLDRLVERRVTNLGTGEALLTAWHPNGQKRLEGRLVKNRPDREWRWWNNDGRETLTVNFHVGVPEEFAGQSKLEDFVKADFGYESLGGTPLEWVVSNLTSSGFSLRIECANEDLQRVRKLGINTDGVFNGGLGIYVALRRVGLTLGTRVGEDGTEMLVIIPKGEG